MLHCGMGNGAAYVDESSGHIQDDLRRQLAAVLIERADVVTADTVAIFPYSGAETLDTGYCQRLGQLLTQLLAFAVRDGRLDPRGGFVADLHHLVLERPLSMERLFTFAYLTERTALDELALNHTIGATSEAWPLVAQLVRRASFDLLAAYAERMQLEPSEAAVIDKLTTLHTRPLLDAVLAKELERAGRFGLEISLILFDVDRLSAINQEHGYGVGDKILERLGILIRQYFRQHDWVARHSEDSIVVLLSRTDADHASELAERVRATVEERLGFTDHRTDRAVPVTISAAVINVAVAVGDIIDPERLLADAEAAVERAKQQGRNRVERVDGYSGAQRTDAAAPSV
jgi:diguanylate cyclase (GGDEF)-like protein